MQSPLAAPTVTKSTASVRHCRIMQSATRVAIVLLAAALSVPAGAQLTRAPAALAVSAAPLPPLDAATRLLVVAPHPDDETLCCGGIIQRVLAAGGEVSVLWITSGDAARWDLLLLEHALFNDPAKGRALGEQRMAEARAAAAQLGVPPAAQLFLGYPDGGVSALLDAAAVPYTSATTGAAAVPYAQALFPGHPYTGASLEHDFAAVLSRLQPTLILAPGLADLHPDHRATGRLTLAVAARLGLSARVRWWIVHGGLGWPAPRQLMPGVPLFPAPAAAGLASAAFALTPAEEEHKRLALAAHASQMQMMAPFLLAFVRSNELFMPRAAP
jgi:LmbE family N-acetylglucosaminyl deacetylase